MPMSKEEHNEQLEKLLDPDLEHSERAEILQTLRTDYGTFHSDYESVSTEKEKLQKVKDDLIVSNSQLFRQLGTLDNKETSKEEETKNFSETVSVSSIEKGL